MTGTTEDLSLDTPWAIGEENYSRILQALSSQEIERIIEFGSGISTVRLGQDFPEASIVSIEHLERFHRQTVELLRQHQIENVCVLYCPLRRVRIGLRSYVTYDLNPDRLEHDVDFVLIDGPVESQTLRGREAPLYMVFPLLKVRGLVALDDYYRDSAKTVVQNWLNSYRENLKVIKAFDRLILLQKCGEQRRPAYPGIHSIKDNLDVNMKLGRRKLGQFKRSIRKI